MTTTKPEKAERLQESDVHDVCRQLISSGQKPTVVKLFNQLQRGSMTTIQKFLHTFNDDLSDDSGAVELPTFDVFTDEAVKLSFDVLMAKVYKLANDRAREEFTGERGRLTDEIATLTSELVECRDFCESQSGLIETLEKTNQELTAELSEHLAASHAAHEQQQVIIAQATAAAVESNHRAELADVARAELKTRADQLSELLKDEQAAHLATQGRYQAEATATAQQLTHAQKAAENARVAEQSCQARLEAAAREIDSLKAQVKEERSAAKQASEQAAELRGRLGVEESKQAVKSDKPAPKRKTAEKKQGV
jgi:chromosome segregation ATPase